MKFLKILYIYFIYFLMSAFPFYKQLNVMDCGATCLRMIAKYYGKHYTADTLRQLAGFSKEGVSLLGISDTAEKIGFRTRGIKIDLEQLRKVAKPCILHWDQRHFVVLIRIKKRAAVIADPASGIVTIKMDEFIKHWGSSVNEFNQITGVVLTLEPTPVFYEQEEQVEQKLSWSLIFRYLKSAKWQIMQIVFALGITSILQLAFPFLTQSIVDIGINTQNLQYVIIVLVAQGMLTFSQAIVGFIRSRLLLRVSNILNIQILSDFWIKLTKLPVSYFDVHHTGDTLQRINDHKQIQSFLTGTALNTIFSVVNFLIYAAVLVIYSVELFFVFCIGTIIYFVWVQLFLRLRRKINYQTFHLSAKENTATLQLIQGMQEIRFNNAEKQKRWEWENIQATVFKLNFRTLNFGQLQTAGATFINQMQGIAISFIVAKLVIDGKLTFGSMLAVQYIIGQLSGPVAQWVGFVQSFQDAKISMERLNEIHQMDDEEKKGHVYTKHFPECKSLSIRNLAFTYPGAGNEPVLTGINLLIPEKKITAIVGASGSGKTTLLKILLKVYENYTGEIKLGTEENTDNAFDGIKFNMLSHKSWRNICGVVLQEGFIFNDTIAKNVAIGVEDIDHQELIRSCRTANIHSFIESLPNGYHTKLGADGVGISSGQKQRLLIARAVYKNPEYIFFDEATNSLDANNEKDIVSNLDAFFRGKTVVIVAHRLSTVQNADKIVVIDKGRVAEEGTHNELLALKGKYYELVKNQLQIAE